MASRVQVSGLQESRREGLEDRREASEYGGARKGEVGRGPLL